MPKFYFTFGTAAQFPFKMGWVEVIAESRQKAVKIFNRHYPPVHPPLVNCAFIYDQEFFEQTEMYTRGGCHRVLEA